MIRNSEIIGEASNNIEKHYPEFAADHPELPLAFAYQMRNAVAHGYFKVDLEIVWKTIHNDLPGLHLLVREIIEKKGSESKRKKGSTISSKSRLIILKPVSDKPRVGCRGVPR